MRLPRFSIPMPTTRPWMPTQRCRSWVLTRSEKPSLRRQSQSGMTIPATADEKLRLVEKVIQGRDFTCMVETVNAVEAWLGSVPGHVYANVRQPPLSTLNLAHMIPLSAVWAGEARDHHFKAPPLFLAKTEGSTPFRFSLHVGDVGHTLVVGPTGAGKSVLLALMALQFRRYPNPRSLPSILVARSGPPRSPWVAIGMTSAARSSGESYGIRCSSAPRRESTMSSERGWAADWIGSILGRERIEVTPEAKEHLWSALTSLASAPIAGAHPNRPLSVLLQSNVLKRALQPYCLGGPYGRLLDAEFERLGEGIRPGLRDRWLDWDRRCASRPCLSVSSH